MSDLEHIDELAQNIYDRVSGGQMAEKDVAFLIKYHYSRSLQVIKNINDTSLNSFDRTERLIKLELETGISKTHLL
jgi:hypothetical protein